MKQNYVLVDHFKVSMVDQITTTVWKAIMATQPEEILTLWVGVEMWLGT